MYTTSHYPMRTARTVTNDQGCVIPRQRQGRSNERRRAIAESAAVR